MTHSEFPTSSVMLCSAGVPEFENGAQRVSNSGESMTNTGTNLSYKKTGAPSTSMICGQEDSAGQMGSILSALNSFLQLPGLKIPLNALNPLNPAITTAPSVSGVANSMQILNPFLSCQNAVDGPKEFSESLENPRATRRSEEKEQIRNQNAAGAPVKDSFTDQSRFDKLCDFHRLVPPRRVGRPRTSSLYPREAGRPTPNQTASHLQNASNASPVSIGSQVAQRDSVCLFFTRSS